MNKELYKVISQELTKQLMRQYPTVPNLPFENRYVSYGDVLKHLRETCDKIQLVESIESK